MAFLSDIGLLVLRIALGVVFLYHGWRKLDGKMGGFMRFIGVAETLGGIAVIVGFLTKFAALGLAIIMVGAIWKKINEWHVPFSAMDKTGWEFDLTLLAIAIALVLLNAGVYSVDAVLGLM